MASASRCSAERWLSDVRSERLQGRMTAAWTGAAPFSPGFPLAPSVACGRCHLPCRSGSTFRLRCIEQLDRRTRHHCADGMLIDQLRMPIPTEQDRKVVEPGNYALEFYPV